MERKRTSARDVGRLQRQRRTRKKVQGTTERPRLSVYKSHQYIYAQLIDDQSGRTVLSSSSKDKEFKLASRSSLAAAKEVGRLIAILAREKKVTEVVMDRGGYPYHGKIQALAEGARSEGLKF